MRFVMTVVWRGKGESEMFRLILSVLRNAGGYFLALGAAVFFTVPLPIITDQILSLVLGAIFLGVSLLLVRHRYSRLVLGFLFVVSGLGGLVGGLTDAKLYTTGVTILQVLKAGFLFGLGIYYAVTFNKEKQAEPAGQPEKKGKEARPPRKQAKRGRLAVLVKQARDLLDKCRPRKQAVRGRPASRVEFPAAALVYEKNAFRLLGTDTRAALTQLQRNKGDAVRCLQVGLPLPYNVVQLPGAAAVSREKLETAFGRVEDVLKRLREELFWFWLEDGQQQVLDWLTEGSFSQVREAFQSNKGAWGWHNLAVLEHALVLGQEKTSGLTPEVEKQWSTALRLWADAIESGECEKYFRQRQLDLQGCDPRLDEGFVSNFCQQLPEYLLQVNAAIAEAALAAGEVKYAEFHLNLMGNSAFPEEAVRKIMQEFCARVMEKIKQQVRLFPEAISLEELGNALKKYQEGVALVKETATAPDLADLGVVALLLQRMDVLLGEPGRELENINRRITMPVYEAIKRVNTIVNTIKRGNDPLDNPLGIFIALGLGKDIVKETIVKIEQAKKEAKRDLREAQKKANGLLDPALRLLGSSRWLCLNDAEERALEKYMAEKQELQQVCQETMAWLDDNLRKARNLLVA